MKAKKVLLLGVAAAALLLIPRRSTKTQSLPKADNNQSSSDNKYTVNDYLNGGSDNNSKNTNI